MYYAGNKSITILLTRNALSQIYCKKTWKQLINDLSLQRFFKFLVYEKISLFNFIFVNNYLMSNHDICTIFDVELSLFFFAVYVLLIINFHDATNTTHALVEIGAFTIVK